MTAEDAYDRELVAALRRREPAAFATAFDRYADKIYRLALGLLGDELEADGVVQETFVRLFQKLDSFEGRSRLGTWLYRVAYNVSLDHLRKRRPALSIDDEEEEDLAATAATITDWERLPEEALSNEEVRVFALYIAPSISLRFASRKRRVDARTFIEAGQLPGLYSLWRGVCSCG